MTKEHNHVEEPESMMIYDFGKTKKQMEYFTNNGEPKSLNLYATSKGFSFSRYSLFRPSITEVTAFRGIWTCRVPN
jgi:hypothetical protein